MQPELIAGRYQVLRAIGRGGMGTVWLCRDEVLGREVAVKQIGALPGESATETERAMREARSAAALNHPNAVAIFDVVDHDGRPWLVMEYVEGQTLADEISRVGQLSPQRVADIGAQLAGALARAHERHIVHRDIKPGNVLIDKAGRPKISDFGIARGHGDEQLTQVGFVTGTPGYLSPELARGGDPHPASDVWALGATLYAAVEGQPAYEPRSNPIALLRAITTERPRPMTRAGALRPAIDAMMEEDPARRWDMATIARRLGGIADGQPTATMPRVDADAAAAMPLVGSAATAAMPLVGSAPYAAIPRGDPVATSVIAVPPVEPTKRLQAVAPVVAAAADWRSGPAGPRRFDGGPSKPPPEHRGSGRRWVPLVVVALLAFALGVAHSLGQFGDQGGTATVLGPTSAPTPAKTTPAGATKVSEPPSTTNRADPGSAAVASDPKADKNLEDFVESYYSDVTKHSDRTWDQLSPRMQEAAGGRNGYDAFWKSIDKVRVNQTRANASAQTAVVSLTFRRDDHTTSTETHQFSFVTARGGYLIESDELIG